MSKRGLLQAWCLIVAFLGVTTLQATEITAYATVLDPLEETTLSSDIQAPVKKVYKDMGDTFKKGDVLVELDDVIYRANFLRSMAMLEKARTQKEAKKGLYDDNIVSLFELKEAEAEYTAAEADLVVQKQRLNSTRVVAPYDGKVVTTKAKEYELITPGKELIVIVYDSTLIAKMLLPSKMVNKIRIGQPVFIKLKETGEMVKGEVSRIGAVIDPSSSTIRVEAKIENANGRLKAGMTGKVSFVQKTVETERQEVK